MSNKSIELLAPAGDFEKLKVAFSYGADAVYLAGNSHGLRNAAGNFSLSDIEKGTSLAHRLGKKVYLAVNTFPTDNEMDDISSYLKILNTFDLDAFIVSDPGVFALAKELTNKKIYLSTQSSITNIEAVKFWIEKGASRIVLAREVSIEEAKEIKRLLDIELEMFIHGSMCMSYSGKCTISNYTANRDANKGGCVNSCRWEYFLSNDPNKMPFTKAYLMNSKDLFSVDLILNLINAEISSLKIEGRMKSNFYLANTVKSYREIIDKCLENGLTKDENRQTWINRINSYSNRYYCNGFLKNKAGKESILYDNVKLMNQSNYIGIVKDVNNDYIILQVKNSFKIGDTLNILTFDGKEIPLKIDEIKDLTYENISIANPNSLVILKKHPFVEQYNVVSISHYE